MKTLLHRQRWLVVALVVIAPLAGGCGDEDDAGDESAATSIRLTPETTTTDEPTSTSTSTSSPAQDSSVREVEVRGGSVVGGVQRIAVDLGETITIRVRSDVTDEVHLHGYDLSQQVAPDSPAELTFTADIPGVFELELEERGMPIAQLEVS